MNDQVKGVMIGAFATIMATIVGAAIGVAGTLHATDRQRADALEAEERARRSDVYSNYRDKTWSYLSAQINLLKDPDSCLYSTPRPDDGVEACLLWDGSALDDARSAYISASDDLAIYGTRDVLDASDGLDDVVGAVGGGIPVSQLVFTALSPYNEEEYDKLSSAYDEAEERFALAMCADVSTTPELCAAHVQREPEAVSTPTQDS